MLTHTSYCPNCDCYQTAQQIQVIDRVSGQVMPRATSIIGSTGMMGLGGFLIINAITMPNAASWLLMLAAGAMLFFALRTGWLLLFGEPVARFTYHCAECECTWEEREDELVGIRAT